MVILGEAEGNLRVNVGTEKRVMEPNMKTQSSPLDLAGAVKGMYRLLDLINESGSNGYGKEPSQDVALFV